MSSQMQLRGILLAITLLGLSGWPAQAQQQCVSNALAGGTVNAITIPLQPCALSTNLLILTASGANTGAVTLQMAGYPALPVTDSQGNALSAGTIPGAGATVVLTSTGSSWRIVSGNATTGFSGVLGVSSGGTGLDTITTNGLMVGEGTGNVSVVTPGTTGQVLVGNTDSPPSFSDLSGLGVISFSAGSTGLTPGSATAGAVTLGGTLGSGYGGTGESSYTNGQLLIGNGGTGGLSKAVLTAGANMIITNSAGGITLASTGVSSGCGTLGPADGVLYDNGSGGCITLVPGTSGYVLQSGGAGVAPSWAPAAAQVSCCTNETSDFNASCGVEYTVDTTGGAITMTLPSLSAGCRVAWIDAKQNFAVANLTVGRNGATIANIAQDLLCNLNNCNFGLVGDGTNSTWQLISAQ